MFNGMSLGHLDRELQLKSQSCARPPTISVEANHPTVRPLHHRNSHIDARENKSTAQNFLTKTSGSRGTDKEKILNDVGNNIATAHNERGKLYDKKIFQKLKDAFEFENSSEVITKNKTTKSKKGDFGTAEYNLQSTLLKEETDEKYTFLIKSSKSLHIDPLTHTLFVELKQLPGTLVVYRRPSARNKMPIQYEYY